MNCIKQVISYRFFFFLLLFIKSTCAFSQNQTWEVNLNSENSTAAKEFSETFRITCKIDNSYTSTADISRVKIEIENTKEDYTLLMFNSPVDVDKLKKQKPSIRFDKGYGPTPETVDPSNKLTSQKEIGSSEKDSIDITVGKSDTVKFAFYLAKKEKRGFLFWRKDVYSILAKATIKMPITVQMSDREWDHFNEEYQRLKKDIQEAKLCKNPRHRPTFQEQAKPFEEKRTKLLEEIGNIIDKRFYNHSDEKLKQLRNSISSIDIRSLAVENCGDSHVYSTPHRCKYCGYSLEQIYNKLDKYYLKLYNSNNRKELKASIIDDINLLYRCCTDKRCRNHSNAWKTSEYAPKITDIYQRISRF